MHEYGLVQALLERVEREASAHDAAAVPRITVRIGPLAGVDRQLVADAYRMCRPGTRCEDAWDRPRGRRCVTPDIPRRLQRDGP
jgi:hydrogenase nickel incorporation protein HypA/HybF